jgi:putative FmdB family regulatory protein
MPIYAYECKDCGVRFERRQGFDDDPIAICPECGGEVHRLIQPAGIIFKGSGFYVTDNRGSSSSSTFSKAKSSSKDGGESDKSDKSEAKEPPTKSKDE